VHLPWLYDERAALIVRALKYGRRPELARRLGETMASALEPGGRPDLVLEVPLHPTRLRERGYNQAGALADAVASHLRAPRLVGALERIRATRAQARLGPEQRRRNLAGAFRIREPDQLADRS
jgi:predicted amidophosphoribosyltransferase